MRIAFLVFVSFSALAPVRAELPAVGPVFDPFRFGARGDGRTNDRAALQKAIDACPASGGTVRLHDGRFLTGQLTLRSNLTLEIAPTAILLGIQSTDAREYPVHPARVPNHVNATCQRRLLFGEGLRHVTLTGGGIIDGQGAFPPWISRGGKVPEKDRPSLVEIADSTDVAVTHLRLRAPACWTQVYLQCDGLTLRDLDVDTGTTPGNKDGIDVCDCHRVRIAACVIRAQDDGICFKSGSPFGCRDIDVGWCVVDKLGLSAGNCVKFGTPTQGAFVDVLCHDLVLRNTGNSALTWEDVDGAEVRHVEVRDVRVSGAAQVFSVLLGHRHGPPGRVSNLIFRRIRADGGTSPTACLISGEPGNPVRDVLLEDLALDLPGGAGPVRSPVREYAGEYPEGTHFGRLPAFGLFVRHAAGIRLVRCRWTADRPDGRPAVARDDVAAWSEEP